MIKLKQHLAYGVSPLSDYISGKHGLVISNNTDNGYVILERDSVSVVRSDFVGVAMTDDGIDVRCGGEETYMDNMNGNWIGNYYSYDDFCNGKNTATEAVIEEYPELCYAYATYVFVVEGKINSAGMLSVTGNPKTFSFGGKSYQYITYTGNFSDVEDNINFSGSYAAAFTGRMAKRWLHALENSSFMESPTWGHCVSMFDISINDGYSTITSMVPVRNVYVGNCLTSMAYPNVTYDVIGYNYGNVPLILFEPEDCQMPYRFIIRRSEDASLTSNRVIIQRYTSGNGGEPVDVMWLTENTMERGATYLVTVQSMVARMEKVIKVGNS